MSKKRVLIVDDEIDTLKLLKMIVEISGYEAYTTLNSLEALTLAQVEQPDVILLDIMMPKMDGFQLCKLMRAHPQTNNLPVIFVTAYPALDLEDRRKACGADMVIQKPIDMDQLVKSIEQVQGMDRIIPADIQKASGIETPVVTPPQPAVPAKPVSPATPPAAPVSAVETTVSIPPAETPAPAAAPTAATVVPAPVAPNGTGAEKKSAEAAAVPAETEKAKETEEVKETPKSTDSTPK